MLEVLEENSQWVSICRPYLPIALNLHTNSRTKGQPVIIQKQFKTTVSINAAWYTIPLFPQSLLINKDSLCISGYRWSKIIFLKCHYKKKTISATETKGHQQAAAMEEILKNKVRFCHCSISAWMQKKFTVTHLETISCIWGPNVSFRVFKYSDM